MLAQALRRARGIAGARSSRAVTVAPALAATGPRPAYRADVDGLRAVAIAAVIGFHAFPDWIPGGFVGVDIFFVISGFLISSLIVARLATDRFSFAEFYMRRVRRIFPALLVVFAFVLAGGWVVLLAHEYQQLGKHVAGGAGFLSNFVLWEEVGYFDNAGATKPLLHLWSLGVEEQFYLVWPVALVIAWRARRGLLAFVVGVLVLSFWWNVRTLQTDAISGFYSPLSRFWELMLGAALACGLVRAADSRLPAAARNASAIAGSVLIAIAAVFLTRSTRFPGWPALLPTAGTALLILAGERAWVNRALLSRPAVVAVGLISYPLYLWHWVLLSLATILSWDQAPLLGVRVALVVLSVLLASATYLIVERPIRFGPGGAGASTVAALVALMVCAGGVGYVIQARGGIPSRIRRDAVNDRSVRGARIEQRGATDCGPRLGPSAQTGFCESTPDPEVAILGDSHAAHLFAGFVHSPSPLFRRAMLIAANGCWAMLDAEIHKGCNAELRAALDIVAHSPTVKYVVLAGYYGRIDDAAAEPVGGMIDGYLKTIRALQATGARVVFVIDPPTLRVDPEVCLRRRPIERPFPRFFFTPAFCGGASAADLESHGAYDSFVSMLRQADSSVTYYDPATAFCANGVCKVFAGDRLLYFDNNHLSVYGSEYLVNDLVAHLE